MNTSTIERRRRRRSPTAVVMTFALLLGSGLAASAQSEQDGFRDLSESSVHAQSIYTLTDSGVISGYPDRTFRPADPVTRGQLATMVVAGFDLEADADDSRFHDVAGSTHATSIGVLVALEAVEGYQDGTFRPDTPVTRAQAASILGRVLEARPVAGMRFSDVPGGSTHAGFINALDERDVINGYEDGTFGPGEDVRRDQFASMLYRAIESQGIGAGLPAPARSVALEILTMAEEGDLDGLAQWALQGPIDQPRGTPGSGFSASFGEEVSTPEELVALWEEIGRDEVLSNLIAFVSLPDWYPLAAGDSAGGPRTIYVTPRYMHEPTAANRAVLEDRLGAEVVEASIADGDWLGWRLGITGDGEWLYFVSGD